MRGDRLPQVLVDLAAGRAPEPVTLDPTLLTLAVEHRMHGLLWSWARAHAPDSEPKRALAMRDLAIRAHGERVWTLLQTSTARLGAAGIEVATIKGVTAEARWYARRGERPCSDVDLWLAPHQLDRAGVALAVLQPDHPWVPHLDELVRSGRVQSVTAQVEGVEVDLHLDPLKLGIRTRQADELWGRTTDYILPDGGNLRVLDETSALLHFLVHLNKDRFQRLLGFADVPRLVATGQIDWSALARLSRDEGIDVAVFRSLEVVHTELGLRWPSEAPRPRGPRARVWNVWWHPGVRLRGREGRLRFRMRQHWIAVSARGRTREALWWWMRDLWPPAAAVRARYAEIRGPYLWRLAWGRITTAVATRRALGQSRRPQAAERPGDDEEAHARA